MSSECNKCRSAGFPGQMINFRINPNKAPAPGKAHYWDLLNSDESAHIHKTKETSEQTKLANTDGDTAKYPHQEILAALSRIEKQNNTIIDYLAERSIGDD